MRFRKSTLIATTFCVALSTVYTGCCVSKTLARPFVHWFSPKAINSMLDSQDKVKYKYKYDLPKDIVAEGLQDSTARLIGVVEHISKLKPNELLNIVLVHGMTTKKISDYDDSVELYDANLKIALDSASYSNYGQTLDLAIAPSLNNGNDTSNIRVNLRQIVNTAGDTTYVMFTFVHWSPSTARYKRTLLSIDASHKDAYIAPLNRLAKDAIVKDGFADVTALLDLTSRNQALRTVEAAIWLRSVEIEQIKELCKSDTTNSFAQKLVNISKAPSAKTLIVSGSLGTKLVLEYLSFYDQVILNERFIGDPETNGQTITYWTNKSRDSIKLSYRTINPSKVLKELKTEEFYWYGMSNQLPLLSSIRLAPTFLQKESGQQSLLDLKSFDRPLQDLLQRTTFYSFYDPNDILGFRATRLYHDSTLKAQSHTVIRIPIDPVVNIGAVNPLLAHSGIKDNPYFGHILINGWSLKSSDLPKPSQLVVIDERIPTKGWLQKVMSCSN